MHMAMYSVHFFCNECSEVHTRRGIVLPLDDGPSIRASIGATYAGKELPAILANLGANVLTCPKTGKLTSQKDNYKVFLLSEKIRGGLPEWRVYNNRWFRLVSYKNRGAAWIAAAQIKASTTETIMPIDDMTRPFATEEEANYFALGMAIEWMNAN
jgi:hypothetical protein